MTSDRHTVRRPVMCDQCGVRPAALECVDCLYPVCDGCWENHEVRRRAIEGWRALR